MKRDFPFGEDKAATYYNTKREMSDNERRSNRLFFLRNFNNWVKSSLISDYARPNMSTFDLCCGKGGDLFKWKIARAGHFVGSDLSEGGISDAIKRFMDNGGQSMFPAIFIKNADTSSEKLDIDKLLPKQIVFDIVSCQMAMHYSFKDENAVRNFLRATTCRLAPGGYFIGTVPDANVITSRLSKTTNHIFGNDFYKVKFDNQWNPELFSMKYYFYLEDAVGRKEANGEIVYVSEYLVIFDKFVEIAKEFDLEFVKKWNFKDFEEEHIKTSNGKRMYDRKVRGRPNDTKEDIENQKEIVYMYVAFCFKKKGKEEKFHGACGYCGCKSDPLVIDAECGLN